MITNQSYVFLVFVIVGMIIGILFDFFRILRKSMKTKDFVTYIEDILFCIITGIIIIYSIFYFNSGEFRIYMFIGLLIGCSIYLLTISQYVVKINVYILTKFIEICKKFFNIIFLPIRFIYIKTEDVLKKLIKLQKNTKKIKNREDF